MHLLAIVVCQIDAASLNIGIVLDERRCEHERTGQSFFPHGLASVFTVPCIWYTTRLQLGQILPSDDNPFNKIPMDVVGSEKHCAIARKIAQQGIVMLKNDNLLPLKDNVKKIVVTGPYAHIAQLGGYSGVPTHRAVTPFDGIKAAAGEGVEVEIRLWKHGMSAIPTTSLRPEGDHPDYYGLQGEYFHGASCEGTPKTTRVDRLIDFKWPKPIENIDPEIPQPIFSVRWTGKLVPDITALYTIAGRCDDGVRIWLDGKKIVDNWSDHSIRQKKSKKIKLEAGKSYDIRMEYYDAGGEAEAHLEWQFETKKAEATVSDPVNTVIVYVAGFNLHMADEFNDLMDLNLPRKQLNDIKKIKKEYPNVVVVLNGGTIVTGDWLYKEIPAVLHAWYPGQEGGHALADLLFGKISPSGRLPLTSFRTTAGFASIDDYDLSKGRTYMYTRKNVRYPFGYGLSYTTFSYDNLALSSKKLTADDVLTVTFDVANTGNVDADEVAQIYVKQLNVKGAPAQQLKAFKRVPIAAGATEKVSIDIPVERLERWSVEDQAYSVRPGRYEVRVGPNAADIRLRGRTSLTDC